MNNIIIFEPSYSGHHFALYLRLIIRHASKNVNIYLITTKNAANHESFEIIKKESRNNIRFFFIDEIKVSKNLNNFSLLLNQFKVLSSLRRVVKELKKTILISHVYVNTLDNCDKILSFWANPFFGIPYSGLLISPKFHRYNLNLGQRSRADYVFKKLFERLISQKFIKNIFVIDEVFYDFALKSFDNRDKLILLKEPTIERILMPSSDIRTKNIFDVKNGKFCILVFGGISNRKGVVELLKALKNNTNDKFCVIIAGKIEKEVELFLESDLSLDLIDRNILFVFPGFKSEIEQDMLFESCDVVWVGYVNGFSSSSGVFFQSGQYSKPVLSCNNGLISFLVKKYNNGLLCNVQSWEDIILNLELLCADKNLYNLFAKNSKNMIQLHSGDIFGKKITEKIQGVVK